MAAGSGRYARRARLLGVALGGTALATLLTACSGEQSWSTYTSDDGLPAEAVSSVAVGADGSVWAGTHGGLAVLDGEEETGFAPQEEPVGGLVHDIAVADDGTVWAAAQDGLASFDGERWEADGGALGLPEWSVSALAEDPDGRMLAASEGLYRLEDGGQRWRRLREGPGSVDYAALTVADDGTVWAAPDAVSGGEALFEYDGDGWTTHVTAQDPEADSHPAGMLPGRLVRDVVVADDGTVWAGTDQGLARYDGERWTRHGTEDGLPHAGVRALAIDQDDALWIATLQEGVGDPDHAVTRLDGDEWTTYTTDDGLPDGWVEDLVIGPDGEVWAATSTGLARFDG